MSLRWRSLLALVSVSILAFALWRSIPTVSSPVDWTQHPVVVLQSDDWGLCAWLPDSVAANTRVEEIESWGIYTWASAYHRSTLESAEDIERLAELLGRYRGGDGQPPVLQANTIVAAPDFEGIESTDFERLKLQRLGDYGGRWERPLLLDATRTAINDGVWYPEYHGLLHINAQEWLRLLRDNDPQTRSAFVQQLLLNDEWSDEFEYDTRTPLIERERLLAEGIAIFSEIFDRPPRSTIAPDYGWADDMEAAFSRQGIKIVQGWRSQTLDPSGVGRVQRFWRRFSRPMGHYDTSLDLLYLYRNVHFEPAEHFESRLGEIASASLASVERAWSSNEPAVLSTHRVNYARLDIAERDRCLAEFEFFLRELLRREPRTVFLTDVELAQLYRSGTSVLRVRPDEIRLRNYTAEPLVLTIDIPAGHSLLGFISLELPQLLGEHRDGSIELRVPPGDHIAQLQATSAN